MPRSLRGPIRIQLKADQGTDQWFVFRSLCMEDERTLGNMHDQIVTQDDLRDSLTRQLIPFLIDWDLTDHNGNDVEFEPEKLFSIINTQEALDLSAQLLSSGRVDYEEKKRSESPHSSEPECFASTAPQESVPSNTAVLKSNAPAVTVLDVSNAQEAVSN